MKSVMEAMKRNGVVELNNKKYVLVNEAAYCEGSHEYMAIGISEECKPVEVYFEIKNEDAESEEGMCNWEEASHIEEHNDIFGDYEDYTWDIK